MTSRSQGTVRRHWSLALALFCIGALGATIATGAAGAAGAAGATELAQADLRASPLSAVGPVIDGVKSDTSRIARSDPSLLERTDAEPVNVMVKLDYDSVATYDGGVAGLAPTSPSTTGKELKENQPAVEAYEAHLQDEEAQIVAGIEAAVPSARVRDSFRVVYGGVSITLPASEAKKLVLVDGVVAVQADRLLHLQTDVTPRFLGATNVYPFLGGRSRAGEGVIVGVLDTGITPQHPSFADPGIDHPGGSFACEFGGSDPDLGPGASCNDKLIGAHAFVDTYLAVLGAEDGEFCNDADTVCSARDADGHGTHTASTAAGGPVSSAGLFGVERGPLSGIAPGAHVIGYRVCLALGCFSSDSVAAVEQAIRDGVDVINFSISGGSTPFTDPVELAFLEFYEAGGLANASAGNEGPGAGTANHGGPWTNTVGASTSPRHFLTTLRMRAADGARFSATGATITPSIPTDRPVVLSTDIGGDALCAEDFPPNAAAGKIVVCQRGPGRAAKSFRVKQAGGVGMILYNATRLNLFTDNHWVPTVHIEGPEPANSLLAFLGTHSGETARWRTGIPTQVRPDEMTSFSSRGPLGDFIKPDVTAPGLQILAGTTPTPWPGAIHAGPPGELFMAIAGTSMSSPHAAGVAALVKAAHPGWTPGQIKSAMMTSSVQDVVKEDGVTPADPFDRGAGSIRVDRAIRAAVTFDVPAADYIASAGNPLNRINLNLPSINAPTMAGEVTTTRTLKNVSGRRLGLSARTRAPARSSIVVRPSRFTLEAGASQTIEISILGKELEKGKQYFGQVTLDPDGQTPPAVLPVAFFTKQGVVTLAHTCAAASFRRGSQTRCEVKAVNLSPAAADTSITLTGARRNRLEVGNVSAGATATPEGFRWTGTLSGAVAPEITAIQPGGSPAGYIPLSVFGVSPIPDVGDESIVNLDTPGFTFGSESYNQVGMTSNGYAVVGGGDGADVNFVPQILPNRERPNNVLAPFWTDLNPATGGALRAATLSDGTDTWIVLEWENVPTFGNPAETDSFQIWIQTTAEAVSYAYGEVGTGDPDAGLNVGAENRDGSSGKNLGSVPASGSDYSILTAPPKPGGSVLIGYDALGLRAGRYQLVARLTSDVTVGEATEVVNLSVTRR